MELTQLQYFMAVADNEHITKTAELLHITQSALSMSISKLEHEVGVRLFERKGRTVRLTYAGKLFASQIGPALAKIKNAQVELSDLACTGQETIDLAVEVPDYTIELICQYLKENPEARFCQTFETAKSAIEKLIRRKAVFCLSYQPSLLPEIESELLLQDRVMLLIHKNHPLAQREGIYIEEIHDEPVVSMSPEYGFRQWIDQMCYRAGFRPNVVLEVCDLQSITRMVELGLAIGFISESTWKTDQLFVSHKEAVISSIYAIPIINSHCVRTVYISYLKEDKLSAHAHKFLLFARNQGKRISTEMI